MKTLTCTILLLGLSQEDAIQQLEKKVAKCMKTLEANPDDAAASFEVGRWHCFFQGNWDEGLPFLVKGKDSSIADAAKTDLGVVEQAAAPLAGAVVDFGQEAAPDCIKGDRWWDIAKRHTDPELYNILNRALFWYKSALKKVDSGHTRKVIDRISRATDRYRSMIVHPNGKAVDGCPNGWGVVLGKNEKVEGVAVDESRAHSGKSSFRVKPCDHGALVTGRKGIKPETDYVITFWYLCEGTSVDDLLSIWFIDKDDGNLGQKRMPMTHDNGDLPRWRKTTFTVKSPANTYYFRFHMDQPAMREGTVWIDDLSIKVVGLDKEINTNPGFEDK